MSTPVIEEKEIISALRRLDTTRWIDVLAYIDTLSEQDVEAGTQSKSQTFTGQELLDSGLIGIWADRSDVQDSTEFARRLRAQIEKERMGKFDAIT